MRIRTPTAAIAAGPTGCRAHGGLHGLRYANLAVRGSPPQVRRRAAAAALALEPDFATVVAGLNDTLRPQCDLDVTAGHLDAMIGALAAQGATVATMAFPDPLPINPLARPARARSPTTSACARSRAGTRRCSSTSSATPRRPTPASGTTTACANSEGHARIADAFAEARPGGRRPRLGRAAATGATLKGRDRDRQRRMGGEHFAPWVVRRIRASPRATACRRSGLCWRWCGRRWSRRHRYDLMLWDDIKSGRWR